MYMASPGLPKFDYVKPASLDEASRKLIECADRARPVMGGTDLFPKMRDGIFRPEVLVDVKHLPAMGDIAYSEKSGLMIGAAVTMNQIARHPEVLARYSLLAEAASAVGSYQVRNRATIGGNLCNASPCADTALATLVVDARVVLYGPNHSSGSDRAAERELPVAAFLLGPGETALKPGEFLTAIRLPPPPRGAVGRHLKLSRNRLGDLALVSVELLGFPADPAAGSGGPPGTGYTFRVGLGAVAPTVVRATQAERVLAERPPGEETFAMAAESAAAAAAPIDDVRAGSAYRRAMVRNLTLRGLRDVWGRLRQVKANREG
jgi:carbon-monoxide dehydrogenase medium subunit